MIMLLLLLLLCVCARVCLLAETWLQAVHSQGMCWYRLEERQW
jgi:hypothetical protein